MPDCAALIGGRPVTADGWVDVEDPSTGTLIARTPDCGPAQVDQAVEAARGVTDQWRRTSVAERAAVLRRMSMLIERNREELGRLESEQTGKPLTQGRRDADVTARYFAFYASAVETMHGSTIPLNDQTVAFTEWQPHGVTAHVLSWNYPLQLIGRSIAPALAMGNCTVLKPAEEAPLTALRLGGLAIEAGLPAGAFNVVTGLGETAGAALTSHPGIDHISFVGSPEVARVISHAAAENLVPAVMELGGKSPNIIFADAELDRALPVVVNAILQNAGQTCSAGSRLLVQDAIHEEVTARLNKIFAGVVVGPALDDPDLGPLISAAQRERVLGFIADARRDATVRYGGDPLNGGVHGDGYFVQPTLVDDVDPTTRIAQEEVFGPVLAIIAFHDVEEAIALANGTDYGLVAGVWTRDLSVAHRMMRDVLAGQVFVNSYGVGGGIELPFGGFKRSGYGREKGLEGLRGFAQPKTGVVAW